MSDRNPPGSLEFWMQFNCTGDPEPMYSAIAASNDSLELPSEGDVRDCLADIQAQWTAVLSSDYTCGPGFILLGTDGDPIHIDGTVGPAAGSQGTACPPNTAVILKKVTLLPGRRGRGRSYIPGVPEASVSPAGYLDEAVRSDYQGIADNIQVRINALEVDTGAFVAVLLHDLLRDPDLNPTPPPKHLPIPGSGLPPTNLVAWTVESQVATQRRRLRR